VKVLRVDPADRLALGPRLAALEKLATYPLGADSFQLDHGPDYFAFLDRLGAEVDYRVALEGDELLAVGAGVLRQVPLRAGERTTRAWYGADLKVHPQHRGRRIPLRLLGQAFPWNYLRCPRGYGISMDPGDGRSNPVVRLLGRWRWSPFRLATTLVLWSLDRDQARAALPVVEARRGPLRWRSLAGVKDLVLKSTGARLPLLHLEWTTGAAPGARDPSSTVAEPQPDTTHMLCAPHDDPLAGDLAGRGLTPSARASVIAHRMDGCDWRFVLTSEI
jgi:hypothetical protein